MLPLMVAGCGRAAPPVFDVPSLMGKDIDQVKSALGAPVSDREVLKNNGDDTNSKNWRKDNTALLVAFHKNTRHIENFFVSCDTLSGMCDDEEHLLQMGGLQRNDSRYHVEFMPTGLVTGRYTGVMATPR